MTNHISDDKQSVYDTEIDDLISDMIAMIASGLILKNNIGKAVITETKCLNLFFSLTF
jgi:hypothetical protein